jgi:hypothetical protein
MVEASVRASRVREDLADIINTAIEELVRQRFELPAFSALMRAVRTARVTVNRGFYKRVTDAIGETTKQRFTASLNRQSNERSTGWDRVKAEPGQPTVKRIKQFVAHLDWLDQRDQQAGEGDPLAGIPTVKLNRFAAEARALNAARMNLVAEQKRRMRWLRHWSSNNELAPMTMGPRCSSGRCARFRIVPESACRTHKRRTRSGLRPWYGRFGTWRSTIRVTGPSDDRLGAIGALIGPAVDDLVRRCDEQIASATRNHLHLLPRFFRHPRTALMLLEKLPLTSTTQDKRVEEAIRFVLGNKYGRADTVPLTTEVRGQDGAVRNEPLLDLSFVPDAPGGGRSLPASKARPRLRSMLTGDSSSCAWYPSSPMNFRPAISALPPETNSGIRVSG